uniref:dockerin type I domain-containing protein n=1 Tax=Novipirellula sp. TaxID=2795430 RepID=UPI00356A8368
LKINGGDGFDRLTVTLSESEIDLAAFLANQISGFEEVVITTTEAKVLSLDANAIAQAFGPGTSMVLHIGVSQLTANADWTLADPTFVSGVFAQVLRFEGVEILVVSDSPWRNSRDRWDVNNSGSVTASDALTIINRLPLQGESRLPVIESLADFTGMYYDVSGDGKVTALDALNVINRLNSTIETPPAEPEITTALPLPAATQSAVEPSALTWSATSSASQRMQAESESVVDSPNGLSLSSAATSPHPNAEIIDQVMREFSGDVSEVGDEFDSSLDAFDWQMLG